MLFRSLVPAGSGACAGVRILPFQEAKNSKSPVVTETDSPATTQGERERQETPPVSTGMAPEGFGGVLRAHFVPVHVLDQ